MGEQGMGPGGFSSSAYNLLITTHNLVIPGVKFCCIPLKIGKGKNEIISIFLERFHIV